MSSKGVVVRRVAFFDVDGTIVDGVCITEFASFVGAKEPVETLITSGIPRPELNQKLAALFRGYSRPELEEAAICFTNHYTMRRLRIPAIDLMNSLRHEEYELAFVSGSPAIVLEPLAFKLNVSHVFGLQLRFEGEICTGEIVSPRPLAEGKAIIVNQFCAEQNIRLSDCAACGDHISDHHLLEIVGRAFVVSGDRQLSDLAIKNAWRLI
jgi:HAD superfamily phosphoserine phosphatase-like hydrolase